MFAEMCRGPLAHRYRRSVSPSDHAGQERQRYSAQNNLTGISTQGADVTIVAR